MLEQISRRSILLHGEALRIAAAQNPYFGPSLGDRIAPPVLSAAEVAEKRASQSRQVMRHYSLTVMLRKSGIRRSISRTCAECDKTISANKTHCAAHAPK